MTEAEVSGRQSHWARAKDYVIEGGKAIILINGGAAIGVMTFIGNSHVSVSESLGRSITLFAFGALCGVVLFATAYLAELEYGNNKWELARRIHQWSYLPALLGGLLFLMGAIKAEGILTDVQINQNVPCVSNVAPAIRPIK